MVVVGVDLAPEDHPQYEDPLGRSQGLVDEQPGEHSHVGHGYEQ